MRTLVTRVLGMPVPDAAGWDHVCGRADCCEPLPGACRAALLARIDGKTVLIGNGARVTAAREGIVSFRVNDCDDGLFDNRGSLSISITPVLPLPSPRR